MVLVGTSGKEECKIRRTVSEVEGPLNSLCHPQEKSINLFQGVDKTLGLWRARGTTVGRIMAHQR